MHTYTRIWLLSNEFSSTNVYFWLKHQYFSIRYEKKMMHGLFHYAMCKINYKTYLVWSKRLVDHPLLLCQLMFANRYYLNTRIHTTRPKMTYGCNYRKIKKNYVTSIVFIDHIIEYLCHIKFYGLKTLIEFNDVPKLSSIQFHQLFKVLDQRHP